MKTWDEGGESFAACALECYGVTGCIILLCCLSAALGMGAVIVWHMFNS